MFHSWLDSKECGCEKGHAIHIPTELFGVLCSAESLPILLEGLNKFRSKLIIPHQTIEEIVDLSRFLADSTTEGHTVSPLRRFRVGGRVLATSSSLSTCASG